MALRELQKGEEVLVLNYTGIYQYKKGDLVVAAGKITNGFEQVAVKGHISCASFKREHLLCVGDKVTRGPDWKWEIEEGNGVGTVIAFESNGTPDHNVSVRWENDPTGFCYRMTPDHQDLKPVGDSVDEGRPECFGFAHCYKLPIGCVGCYRRNQHGDCICKSNSKDKCKYHYECSQINTLAENFDMKKHLPNTVRSTAKPNKPETIEEDSPMITRKQRARDLEKTKQEAVDARDAAIEKHEEDLAQRNESLDALDDQIADLRDSVTDKEAHIKLIAKANKVDMEQAEAMYELEKLNE